MVETEIDVKPTEAAVDDAEKVAASEGEEVDSSNENDNDETLKKGAYDEAVNLHEQFHMREVVINLPGGSQIRFNPFSSLFAIVILWGLAIWCMVDPENASSTIIGWKARVTELFTWFYVGTNPAFMVR